MTARCAWAPPRCWRRVQACGNRAAHCRWAWPQMTACTWLLWSSMAQRSSGQPFADVQMKPHIGKVAGLLAFFCLESASAKGTVQM
jgi:hypothetical protein